MQRAVLQLSKIVGTLWKQEHQDLDALLDQAPSSTSSTEPALGATRRSNAAALRILTRAFEEQPQVVYESVEMRSDFRQVPAALAPGHCSARAWLCSRSRIGNYQNHVRWAWQVGGIDLMSGNHDKARARAALLLACADQASVDNGSWVVSSVALMEPLPPYQEFAKHSPPLPSENQSSALFDPRWSEVFFMGTLRERESYSEAKKKLQGGKNQGSKGEDPPSGQGSGKKGKSKGDGGSGTGTGL